MGMERRISLRRLRAGNLSIEIGKMGQNPQDDKER